MLIKNSHWEETFLKNGYLLIQSEAISVADQAEIIVNSIPFTGSGGLYYSLLAQQPAMNLKIHDRLQQLMKPILTGLMPGFRSLVFSYLIKSPQVKEEFFLHQDWSITDEERFTCATLWMPLCDVDKSNGCLFVLPGSHAWFRNHRSGSYPTARIPSEGELKKMMVPIPMKKGDLLFFHPALWHGSFGNHSNSARKVVTALLLPEQAPFLHYSAKNDKEAQVWNLPDQAYEQQLRQLSSAQPVTDLPLSGVIPYEHHVPTVTEIINQSRLKVVN